eukprot:6988290-Prymnesium_polylepis.1
MDRTFGAGRPVWAGGSHFDMLGPGTWERARTREAHRGGGRAGSRGGHGPLKLPRFHVSQKPPCFAEHKLHAQADGGCARDSALCQHGGRC